MLKKKILNYTKDFTKDEEGVETIEFIGLVVVAAILIAVITSIGSSMRDTAKTTETELNETLTSLTDKFNE